MANIHNKAALADLAKAANGLQAENAAKRLDPATLTPDENTEAAHHLLTHGLRPSDLGLAAAQTTAEVLASDLPLLDTSIGHTTVALAKSPVWAEGYSERSVRSVLEFIIDPPANHAAAIKRIRATSDKSVRDSLKLKLPMALFAGRIKGDERKDENFASPSCLALLDYEFDEGDAADMRDALFADERVFAAWVSSSGQGVHGLFVFEEPPPDAVSHRDTYNEVTAGLSSTLPGGFDNTSDRVRLCALSHDPDLRLRSNPKPWPLHVPEAEPEPEPEPTSSGDYAEFEDAPLADRVKGALEAISRRLVGGPYKMKSKTYDRVSGLTWSLSQYVERDASVEQAWLNFLEAEGRFGSDASSARRRQTFANKWRDGQNFKGWGPGAFCKLVSDEAAGRGDKSPLPKGRRKRASDASGSRRSSAQAKPKPMQFSTDVTRTPEPRQWLIPGWLPRGTVGVLHGEGEAGKSHLAVQLSVALAAAGWQEFLPLVRSGNAGDFALEDGIVDPDKPVSPGLANEDPMSVVIASWEDDLDELARRTTNTMMSFGIDADGVGNRLVHVNMADEGCLWGPMAEGSKHTSTLGEPKEGWERLSELAANHDARLLIIDVVAAAYGSNENDRSLVRSFMTMLGQWARDHDCAVLLLSHPPKKGGQMSGSTDWRNAARFAWKLGETEFVEKVPSKTDEGKPTTKSVKHTGFSLLLEKSNYAESVIDRGPVWLTGPPFNAECDAFSSETLYSRRKPKVVIVDNTGHGASKPKTARRRAGRNAQPSLAEDDVWNGDGI